MKWEVEKKLGLNDDAKVLAEQPDPEMGRTMAGSDLEGKIKSVLERYQACCV